MQELINEMLEKGLINIDNIHNASQIWQALKELEFTITQTSPDLVSCMLRKYQRN